MRDLVVLALSDDGTSLLLAARPDAARPTHRLPVDDRLHAALRGSLPAPAQRPSALSPREIQARLRAGESPEQVARVAGVPVARVLRYADPVLAERARMVDEARAARTTRQRSGASVLPVGEAVDRHLAETSGLRPESVEWTARRRDDGTWVAALHYVARGRARSAEWSWDPAARQVAALDPLAAKLGHVASGAAKAGGKKRPAKSGQSGAGRSGAGKPISARKPNAAPARKRTPARPAPKPVAEEAPQPRTEGVRAARSGNRPEVPSWSDVLLGVRTPAPAEGARRQSRGRSRRQP